MGQSDDIFSLHASLRDRTREVEMSLGDYLEACRKDPLCYASPAERMLRAIGEPENGRYPSRRPEAQSPVPEPHHADLPGLLRIPRHGRYHRAHRRFLPPRGAGA